MNKEELKRKIQEEIDYRKDFSPYECSEAYDAYFGSVSYQKELEKQLASEILI